MKFRDTNDNLPTDALTTMRNKLRSKAFLEEFELDLAPVDKPPLKSQFNRC